MEPYISRHWKALELLIHHAGEINLDYGIGNGRMSRIIASSLRGRQLHGYDGPEVDKHFSGDIFAEAQRLSQRTPHFTILNKEPEQGYYEAIILNCVLHGNEQLIERTRRYLQPFGTMIVLDHDKSHLSEEEFRERLTQADQREVQARGFDAVFRDHRRMSLADCIYLGKQIGLSTVAAYNHSSPEFAGHPFYLWVGKLE